MLESQKEREEAPARAFCIWLLHLRSGLGVCGRGFGDQGVRFGVSGEGFTEMRLGFGVWG